MRIHALALPLIALWVVAVSRPVVAAEPPAKSSAASASSTAADAAVEKRVQDLLDKMTLEEKIDYIGGHESFYIRPIERLGIPAIKMSDGPVGMRNDGKTTAYPAGICLAATWNPELAARYGTAVGRDGRARGVHIWLAPGVNIYRAAMCGRNFEYFGEDPYLASRMAVPLIQSVQKEGVLATVKHYAANNMEYARHTISSEVDERTMREIYLPAFEASVKEGKVACIMDAYNLYNGTHCTANAFLNIDVAKKDWGFDGVIMSDWGAVHETVGVANGGMDLEMPGGEFLNRKTLLPAIEAGTVSKATIDDKVRRILRVIVRAGFLDRPQKIDTIPLDDPKNAAVALDIAREGIVLLKNETNLLPLDAAAVKTIAVIGPGAHPGVPAGGGSSYTTSFHSISILTGIQARAGKNIAVLHEAGEDPAGPSALAAKSVFSHAGPDGKTVAGLKAEYFANEKLQGKPAVTTVAPTLNFDWADGGPEGVPVDGYSARWTGQIAPKVSGSYSFMTLADDGVRVFLDGKPIIKNWKTHAAELDRCEVDLEGGKTYSVKVEYFERGGSATMYFGWGRFDDSDLLPAVELAKKTDVAVVCVGFEHKTEREGADRPFELSAHQTRLIQAVSKANPRTVVVLTSGGAVAWEGWLDSVPALVQAWYPGQEGGTAVVEILFGDVNPSGKIPATFENVWEENPVYDSYDSKDGKTLAYTEGIFVGYRGYDAKGTEPRFCFGHGLSYTTFEYKDLRIEPSAAASGAMGGAMARATFTVKNTGSRAGMETAQVYIHDVESRVPRPPKELKGFAKVALGPGESKTVSVELNDRAFSFFDPAAKKWTIEKGTFEVMVGASSRDIRQMGKMTLSPKAGEGWSVVVGE